MDRGNRKRETHILKQGLGLTKKIIAHYGSVRSPGRWATRAGGRREGGRENKRVKLSELQVGLSRDTSSGLGGQGKGRSQQLLGSSSLGLQRAPGQGHLGVRGRVRAMQRTFYTKILVVGEAKGWEKSANAFETPVRMGGCSEGPTEKQPPTWGEGPELRLARAS